MKPLFLLLFLFGGLATFAQNKIDGSWKGTRETPNGTFEINYTFKVDGKKFSFAVSFNDRTTESTGELVSDDEIVIKNERGELKLSRVKTK